jgi:putative hydrolase of the HAD superfamily
MDRHRCAGMRVVDWRRVRAVSFDVGGTLIAPWPSVGHVYARVAQEFGLRAEPEKLNGQFRTAWANRQAFTHSRAAWQQLVNQAFQGLCPTPIPEPVFAAIFAAFGRAASWRIFPDVLPTLRALRARGIELVVVSNWDERLRPLLDELKLAPFFKGIVISCEVGFPKPAPEIFAAAQAQLNLPGETILHLGDSRDEDVDGARRSGWRALHLRRDQGVSSSDAINSLEAIL